MISTEINKFSNTPTMPVLFVGHGNPMNAIEENEFVEGFRTIAKTLPSVNAILCISAHWETRGTFVTSSPKPSTIHDFGGFPKELYDVQYPAPGCPSLAMETKSIIKNTTVELDEQWGLDHGCWTVVKHLFPKANVPIIEMSLNKNLSAQQHYNLAKELKPLRNKGVLILGSGNFVHNLQLLSWEHINDSFGFDWAMAVNEKVKNYILTNDLQSLINFSKQGAAFKLAIPTAEHFLPLLYILALKENNETINFYNDKPVAGSLTMTCVKSESI